MSAAEQTNHYRISQDSPWAGAWKIAAALAALGFVGVLLSALGVFGETARLGYSYLFALVVVWTFMLGGMFLVLIQHLTTGHWGVSSRRIPEVFMSAAPVVALLALPFVIAVATGSAHLYDEWMGAHHDDGHAFVLPGESVAQAQHGGAHAGHAHDAPASAHQADEHTHTPQERALHHKVIEHKAPYLNKAGWLIRTFLYFGVWIWIALAYFRWSQAQDETKDPALTVKMKQWSALALIGFGLTLTFAAFDWLMALEAAWYSTIFGVIIFAASAVAILALTILIGLSFYQNGLVGKAINPEHFHDLGKLLFGFICFWTYVQFSQWMLIWYAGIPEEATWYHKRWEHGWQYVSLALIFLHFVAPFVLLISRLQKRALPWLQFMCIWMVAMHVVDMFWFVMPQVEGATPLSLSTLIDLSCLLFVGGAFFAYVFRTLSQVPLIPMGDPRLARSLAHHQSH